MQETINERILQIQEFFGMNGRKFAQTVGTTPQTINYIKKGTGQPSYGVINGIIREFPQVDARWLITGDGEMIVKPGSDKVEDNLRRKVLELEKEIILLKKEINVKQLGLEQANKTITDRDETISYQKELLREYFKVESTKAEEKKQNVSESE